MEASNKYTKLYDEVLALPNTLTAKVILCKLNSFHESGHRNFMKNSWLANQLQLSERQIRRYLTELESSRLIVRQNLDSKRLIKLGQNFPVIRTEKSVSHGYKPPQTMDNVDHILKKLNKQTINLIIMEKRFEKDVLPM